MKWLLASVFAMGMVGCHETRSARKIATHPTPDWSIGKCRISYKGRLVPLGDTITKWVEMFGPPSDSTYMFNERQPGFQFYVWDKVGITAGARAFQSAGHLYSVMLFLEPTIDEEVKPRFPKQPISKGVLIDGQYVDSTNFHSVVSELYEESTERCCPKPLYRRYMIGDSLSLNSGPNLTDGVPKGALSFFLYPIGENNRYLYATEVQKLDANCTEPSK